MLVRNLKGLSYFFYCCLLMRVFLLCFLLFSSLFIAVATFQDDAVHAESQNWYTLQLQGFAWTHTTLQALVLTPINESWWSPSYLNCVLRAIGQWNEAVTDFAANNTEFAYLSNLSIKATVSNQTMVGYDIYINWTESPLSNTSDEVGLSRIFSDGQNSIVNSSINLSAHTNHGDALNEVDAQNIALHELGHSLGLGHCNFTGDLMYPAYILKSSPQEISSLDVYGVATVFGWENNASSFYPVEGWLTKNNVSLTSDSAFHYLPVSSQNAPPKTLANNQIVETIILIIEIMLHPEFLAVIFIVVLVAAIVLVFLRERRIRRVRAGS